MLSCNTMQRPFLLCVGQIAGPVCQKTVLCTEALDCTSSMRAVRVRYNAVKRKDASTNCLHCCAPSRQHCMEKQREIEGQDTHSTRSNLALAMHLSCGRTDHLSGQTESCCPGGWSQSVRQRHEGGFPAAGLRTLPQLPAKSHAEANSCSSSITLFKYTYNLCEACMAALHGNCG